MIAEAFGVLLSVGGAIWALRAKHLMRGVMGLTAFFIGLATLFGTLGAWYLAIGQLFLFVGGVVTLFVLAFNFAHTPLQNPGKMAGLVVTLLLLGALGLIIPPVLASGETSTLAEFASVFFSQYGWVLNAALLLLFSALIGAQYLLEVDE